MAQHWDVSSEFRGEHGKWAHGGGVIHRLTAEAESAGKQSKGGFAKGHKVKYKTGATGTVHHVDEKGVPHVVWDRGRGKPVRTPAHHLTHAGEPAAAEKAARDVTSKDWRKEKLAEIGHPAPDLGHQNQRAGQAEALRRIGQYKQPTSEMHAGAIKERKETDAAINSRLAGKHVNITGGVSNGESGKIINADRYGATVDLGGGRRATVGHTQFEEASGKQPGPGKSPDELRKMIAEMEATQKARMEAENRARMPGGNVTEYSGKMGNLGSKPESPEYLAKLPGGGVQKNRIPSDTGYTPGKGVGGRYRGAKPASYYQGLSDSQLENLVKSRGSQAAQDEIDRRRGQRETARRKQALEMLQRQRR